MIIYIEQKTKLIKLMYYNNIVSMIIMFRKFELVLVEYVTAVVL